MLSFGIIIILLYYYQSNYKQRNSLGLPTQKTHSCYSIWSLKRGQYNISLLIYVFQRVQFRQLTMRSLSIATLSTITGIRYDIFAVTSFEENAVTNALVGIHMGSKCRSIQSIQTLKLSIKLFWNVWIAFLRSILWMLVYMTMFP